MSRDMKKGILIVLICGVVWLMVGAILAPRPQTIRDWVAILFLALGWFAIGFGSGGGVGYEVAHKEEQEAGNQNNLIAHKEDRNVHL